MSDLTQKEAILRIDTLIKQWNLYNDRIENSDQALIDGQDIEALKYALENLKANSAIKEAYNKGYKDGQEALAYHLELCKEGGNIIEIPDEATTNKDIIMIMFPNTEFTEYFDSYTLFSGKTMIAEFRKTWLNSPYKEGVAQ